MGLWRREGGRQGRERDGVDAGDAANAFVLLEWER